MLAPDIPNFIPSSIHESNIDSLGATTNTLRFILVSLSLSIYCKPIKVLPTPIEIAKPQRLFVIAISKASCWISSLLDIHLVFYVTKVST